MRWSYYIRLNKVSHLSREQLLRTFYHSNYQLGASWFIKRPIATTVLVRRFWSQLSNLSKVDFYSRRCTKNNRPANSSHEWPMSTQLIQLDLLLEKNSDSNICFCQVFFRNLGKSSLVIWENTVRVWKVCDNFDPIIKSNQARLKLVLEVSALTVGPKVNPDFHYRIGVGCLPLFCYSVNFLLCLEIGQFMMWSSIFRGCCAAPGH